MGTVQAALVTPLSGPLARFGLAGAAALSLWAERAPGLPAGGVALEVVDAHPSPAAAMREALGTRPDAIFGPYGSSPAVAAAGATDRAVWNHGGATDRLRRPEFPTVINVLAPASTYFSGTLRAVQAAMPCVSSVSVLHAGTGFGREVAGGAAVEARRRGLRVETVPFVPGRVQEAASALPAADVLLVAGSFEDELAAARLLLARPWGAAAFVGAGVEEVLAPLGPGREGLIGPSQWVPRAAPPPDEGPDAAWFVDAFREAAGSEPPYPAAAAFAAGILWARCVRAAGTTEDAGVLAAAEGLRAVTLFGKFALDPETGLQVGHEMVTVQWQGGERRIVWPPERAERAVIRYTSQ